MDEVLKYLKLEKYAPHFEREDIDMQTFLTLTDADLKAITIDLLGDFICFFKWLHIYITVTVLFKS